MWWQLLTWQLFTRQTSTFEFKPNLVGCTDCAQEEWEFFFFFLTEIQQGFEPTILRSQAVPVTTWQQAAPSKKWEITPSILWWQLYICKWCSLLSCVCVFRRLNWDLNVCRVCCCFVFSFFLLRVFVNDFIITPVVFFSEVLELLMKPNLLCPLSDTSKIRTRPHDVVASVTQTHNNKEERRWTPDTECLCRRGAEELSGFGWWLFSDEGVNIWWIAALKGHVTQSWHWCVFVRANLRQDFNHTSSCPVSVQQMDP